MRVRREPRSHDLDALESVAQEQRAAGEERLQDDFPDVGQRVDGLPQRGGRQLQHLATSGRAAGDERGAPGQRIDIPRELARLVHRHLVRRPARLLDDLDGSVEDNEEGEPAVSLLEQHVAGCDRSHLAPPAECVYLGSAEPWERDIVFGWHLPVISNVSRRDRLGVLADLKPGQSGTR